MTTTKVKKVVKRPKKLALGFSGLNQMIMGLAMKPLGLVMESQITPGSQALAESPPRFCKE